MDNNKGLSALSYFSIFFAPFLVPIILLFVAKDDSVRYHAKRALYSHIIPFILGIIIVVIGFITIMLNSKEANIDNTIFTYMFAIMVGYAILTFIISIWNLVQGIKVLR